MASNTPVPDSSARPADQLVPPEERFWQHYSPHGELPLSSIGAFAVHVLVVGLLLLWGLYLAAFFHKPKNAIPVEAVTLDVGGGGGDPSGTAGGGRGMEHPKEAVPDQGETKGATSDTKPDTPKREKLDDVQVAEIKEKFTPDDARYIQQSPNAEAMKVFSALQEQAKSTAMPDNRPRSKGKGGSGTGGGKGTGEGTGEGSAKGPGKQGQLTQRQRRMLRWSMSFNTSSGNDYVAQLNGLGAILAIPITEGPSPTYRVVRDLSRPVQLLDEDVSKINRIFWSDSDPRSVHQVMQTLGLALMPSHFVAFMPEELENELFQMEKKYMHAQFPGLTEDQIQETRFRVVPGGRGGYHPQIVSLTPKRGR